MNCQGGAAISWSTHCDCAPIINWGHVSSFKCQDIEILTETDMIVTSRRFG